ncbi:MAG: tRNA (guanosine(37)-N1)-methyltransferase TrmD [Defluviitaleaceae bacterium]|nr:tRNA (guanosine(37)-N1)-methyltransferase TrmD [Defluviitaleaceae bacterium]
MSFQLSFHVLTLFPEMIHQACGHSILKRATDASIINIDCINIRDFAINKHGQVDDYPYGGGAGMVMMAPPIYDAFVNIGKPNAHFIYMSPQGKPFSQAKASELSQKKDIIILCGHYEGVDQRVLDILSPEEISIGDYVLTGGELAALVVIDAVARLVPGVVGKSESINNESFSGTLEGMLEHPQYTRPPIFNDIKVPDILLSGHHKNIEEWRKNKAFERTKAIRPDLLI